MLTLKDLRHVYFCTGARNHALLELFDPGKLSFEYDERAASFKALGLSKISEAPVGLCCTSGTAVSEMLSALIEAKYSGAPLVLISGDRPKKMHGTGAPQTIVHERVTPEGRGSYVELSLEEFKNFSLKDPIYPVHINVLVDDTVPHDLGLRIHESFSAFEEFCTTVKNPLLLVSHETQSLRPFVEKLHSYGVAFYAETLSGGRELSTFASERDLVKTLETFDSVIRIGHTPLSKVWRLLENKPRPTFSFDSRGLPALSSGEVLAMGAQKLVEEKRFWDLVNTFPKGKSTPNPLEALIQKFPLSEISFFRRIQDQLPEDALVYLGNSLVIRFFELVQKKRFRVFGNRGVNGIDGQLATAIGLASGTTEEVYCLLGDLTTYYDLSSLRELPPNLRLVIMNNRGGRIFETLRLSPRIVLEHEADFKKLTEGFGLSYGVNTLSTQVSEWLPDGDQTRAFLEEWNA